MTIIKKILPFILLFTTISASAQFFVPGDDPGRLKWNRMDTESYRIIYPQGTDSLALTYARKLEKYKIPVSRTSGYVTGEGDGKIMPVVIHAYQDANGSVAWAPKRMDMFAVPSAYDPEPLPWSTMLAVHESRHVSQMQFGLTERQKPGKWFLGEGWNIVAFLLYPSTTMTEGDAVVAETALTPSGRGRTADFLNYYRVAFDQGDFRKWFKWRFVSQIRYSPTYYALGYMTVGGYRYLYDYPEFISEGLHLAAAHPGKLGCLENVGKKISGKKWDEAWLEICHTMNDLWRQDAALRAPFIPAERVLPEPSRYTDYTGCLVIGNDIYAVKSGHVDAPSIVRIDRTGKEHRVRSFSYRASALRWDAANRRIIWSESTPDKRWSLETGSKIRFIDAGSGRTHTLRNDAMLHNPAVSEGKTAVARYHNDGHSSIEILDGTYGKTLQSIAAADSLQLVETAWVGGKVYATAISENGYGIYLADTETGTLMQVLAPQPLMIKDLGTYDDCLIFASDRTGVNELYHFNPLTGELRQKTSTRYGAADFQYSEDGKTLYYTSQTLKGKLLFRTPVDSLIDRKVRFDSLHRYPIAEKITLQETAIARQQGYPERVTVKEEEVKTTVPERYRKVPHLFNLHTWFPAYISVDNVMNDLSFDPLWQTLSLGVSGVMQNHLATAIGEVGYSAHKDPLNPAKWRHSGHFKFKYSGLYPIFKLTLDFNDRGALQYSKYADAADGSLYKVSGKEISMPYVQGKLSMYIPFNFNSTGWNRGVIPQVSYSISNDLFDKGTVFSDFPSFGGPASFVRHEEGKTVPVQQLTGSVRAYTMLSTANSQVYPRWGIGAEAGFYMRPDAFDVFSPMGYVYAYGYMPGIIRTQGLRLSAIWQTKLSDASAFSLQTVDILPRGLSGNSALGSHLSLYNDNIVKVTADYAIPVYIGDITIGGNWLAIKRLVAYPHFDYTFIGEKGLWSAGLNLSADLHAIITLEWPCSVGLSFSWNGGSAWNGLSQKGINMKKWFLGPVFNVSF